ncbi:MAG: hypothetical protein MMC33_005174 [Icmadophila ericetorum]|nr:hypothetical protein [Icmadophila ericetorum]
MDMGTSSSNMTAMPLMSMSTMMMTFFTSNMTPIYSASWAPTNTAQYAGTCIFFVIFSAIFRGLISFKSILEQRWAKAESRRRQIILSTNIQEKNAVQEGMGVVGARPWRISVDGSRACMDTVIVGVGYLLMLAVMTMNVGYYASILGGTFLGSLLVGRYQSGGHVGPNMH